MTREPVIPNFLAKLGEEVSGTEAVMGTGVDDEVVKQDELLLGDKIVGAEHVTLDKDGPGARDAQPLSVPQTPTQAQIAKHNLTHLPYQAWCPFCVSCRRKNTSHRPAHEQERQIPLVVADYAFPRASEDIDGPTMLVMRIYPYKLVAAFLVSAKGPEPNAVKRVAKFLRDAGLTHFAYRSDREPAIRALLEAACKLAGRSHVQEEAQPEARDDSMPGSSTKPDEPDEVQTKDESRINSDRVLVGSLSIRCQGSLSPTVQQKLPFNKSRIYSGRIRLHWRRG